MTTQHNCQRHQAFSLIEVLLVLALISIMAALVINAFSNTAQDSRSVMSRQQQASVQSAVNNWVSGQIGGFERPDSANPGQVYEMTVAYVRNKYNFSTAYWTATPSVARTTMERLDLVSDYLADDTHEHFIDNSVSASQARSSAMRKTDQYIELTQWPAPSVGNRNPHPTVNLYP